jgi:hypothetical protein
MQQPWSGQQQKTSYPAELATARANSRNELRLLV